MAPRIVSDRTERIIAVADATMGLPEIEAVAMAKISLANKGESSKWEFTYAVREGHRHVDVHFRGK